MKIYRKYLIKNLFKPFLISLCTLTILIWSTRVIRFMDYIEDGASFLSFFKLTLFILPSMILLILPLAIFLTTVLTYNKLIENREIVILKNCGIKKIKLIMPLIILSTIIAFFGCVISFYLNYKSNLAIRELRADIANTLSFSLIKPGVFTKIKNIVIYTNFKNENKIYNIIIYTNLKDNNEKIIIQAQEAEIIGNIISLKNGNFQKFDNKVNNIPNMLFFKQYDMKYEDIANKKVNLNIRPDCMSTIYLIKVLFFSYKNDTILHNKNEIIYEINFRLTFPLLSIVMAFFSGALMLKSAFSRVNTSKISIQTSIYSISIYAILLSLYQRVENNFYYIYILYFIISFIIIISLYLLKEKKVYELKT